MVHNEGTLRTYTTIENRMRSYRIKACFYLSFKDGEGKFRKEIGLVK